MKAPEVAFAYSCPVPEGEMTAQGPARRYCGNCCKTVHHLSGLTERQARAFLRQAIDADVCISYYVDRNDEVCFVQPPLHPLRRLPVAVGFAVAMAACSDRRPPRTEGGKAAVTLASSKPATAARKDSVDAGVDPIIGEKNTLQDQHGSACDIPGHDHAGPRRFLAGKFTRSPPSGKRKDKYKYDPSDPLGGL